MDSSDAQLKAQVLGYLILVLTLIGCLVVIFLLIAWRRYTVRQSKEHRPQAAGDHADAWQLAAQRMNKTGPLDEELDEDDEPIY